MKRLLTLLLAALLSFGALAAEKKPELTRRERKDKTAKLSEKHRQFLIEVAPIIQPFERDAFLMLETDAQRDAFIDDFWRRRDRAAGTTNQASHDEYYARLDFVKENFEGISSDRGTIYLLQGQPLGMIDVSCLQYFQPLQIWGYDYIEGLGHSVRLLFYQPRGHRQFRLWDPFTEGLAALKSDDITASSGGWTAQDVIASCKNGEEILGAIARMQAIQEKTREVFKPPPANEEDVGRILRSAVLPDASAPKLTGAVMTVAYPAAKGAKTDAQLTIMIPRAQLKTTSAGGVAMYTIDIVGEVLREEKMWEKYRYRFDFPGDIKDENLPIVIDRFLRPAAYRARVKLTDAASNAQAILESDLTVPEIEVAKTVESETLDVIRDEMQSTRASLRIIPLPENVMSGLQTIQTIVSGTGVKAVEFWLDGKKVATRHAPPYTLDLDFGTMPRARKIRAVALDSHNQPITGDEVVVNTGTDPFRVRIASPRVAPKLSGPTRVEVEVRVPEGKQLASVELYWNETRVATMYDPPFVQTVNIPSVDGVGYLRAVATMKDGDADPGVDQTTEDVVMVNTPDFMETLDVHLVELPTTVLRDGKPVNGLQEAAFKVLDEGQPVKLAKFEHVKDLPLSIGMAVDTSGSMDAKMGQARAAGAAFFQNVMRKGDKAFLVAFDSQPHIVQKWSSDLSEINGGLAKLRPEESTALYDAVVYSLYNFLGVKGQKALILLTDGKDTVSKFSYEQALEYAQRAAVPIYAIGVGIRVAELEVKSKLNRLCSETGGSSYYIDNATELGKIYTDIQNELRSQYVLGFYPAAEVKSGSKWREVSVQVADGKVKTIRGYYP
jgi:Ca-activated chloride channel family protein